MYSRKIARHSFCSSFTTEWISWETNFQRKMRNNSLVATCILFGAVTVACSNNERVNKEYKDIGKKTWKQYESLEIDSSTSFVKSSRMEILFSFPKFRVGFARWKFPSLSLSLEASLKHGIARKRGRFYAPLFTESSSVPSQRGQKHDGVAMLMTPTHPRTSSPSSWKVSVAFLLPPRLPFCFLPHALQPLSPQRRPCFRLAPRITTFAHALYHHHASTARRKYTYNFEIKTLSPPIVDVRKT